MRPFLLALLITATLLPAVGQTAGAAIPVELRRVKGTNYNVGALRAYETAVRQRAARRDNSRSPARPLPAWGRLIGKISEVRDGHLILDDAAFFDGGWPTHTRPVALRNVPADLRKGLRFDGYVCLTVEAFQAYSERWPIYDYGTPVAAPAEPVNAAAERAEAAAKAAAAKQAKQAKVDAAVAKFRAEQAAAAAASP